MLRRNGVPVDGGAQATPTARGPTASRRSSTRSTAGEVDLIVNTPFGNSGRPASTATRSAPRRSTRGIPCLTTVQALARRVQGIEALRARRHRGRPAAGAPCDPAPCPVTGRPATLPTSSLRRTPDAAGAGQGRGAQRQARSAPTSSMTVVAPGIAENFRPGQFVAVAVGGADGGDAAAPGLLDLLGARDAGSTAARSSSSSRSRQGHRVAGPPAPARPDRRRRPARPTVRAAARAGQLRPRRRRLRHGAAVLARRRACAPGAAGSTSSSAPPTGDRLFGASTPSGWRPASRSRPTTARTARRAGSPTSCPR